MTRKSGALAALVALAALALSGVALGLTGGDVPFVPPSVELGGPPVTVAPAVSAEDDRPADRHEPVDRVERRVAPPEDVEELAAPGPSPDHRRGSIAVRTGEATVVTPLPVQLGGDLVSPTVTDVDPTPSITIPSEPDPGSTETAVPVPVPVPTTRPVADEVAPTVPEVPTDAGGADPAPLHIAAHSSCAPPGAPGLAQAGQRTDGTPASPPPQGNGPGCVPGGDGGGGEPRDPSRDDRRDGRELQAVREQDDRRDPGRNRAGAGRGRHGAGGR